MIALVLVLLLLASGLAVALGHAPDTRDSAFGLGALTRTDSPEADRVLRSGIRPHS